MSILVLAIVIAVVLLLFFVVAGVKQAQAVFDPALIDWDALADEELQSYLPDQKIAAIKRYRELTNAGLKQSKEVVEYAINHPDTKAKLDPLKGASARLADTGGAGVRDLIAEGRIQEAVRVYADFMGVDEYSARNAIAKMQDDL